MQLAADRLITIHGEDRAREILEKPSFLLAVEDAGGLPGAVSWASKLHGTQKKANVTSSLSSLCWVVFLFLEILSMTRPRAGILEMHCSLDVLGFLRGTNWTV